MDGFIFSSNLFQIVVKLFRLFRSFQGCFTLNGLLVVLDFFHVDSFLT